MLRRTLALTIGMVVIFALPACGPPGGDGPTPTPTWAPSPTPTPIPTRMPPMGAFEANVTFLDTTYCGGSDRVRLMVENTSSLVYKHAVVLIRDGAAPAPEDWTVPIGAMFYAIPFNCGSPSFVDPQNPWDLKPTEIGYVEGHFIRDDNVPYYTAYYLICSGMNQTGACTQGEIDFYNPQRIFFEAIERVPCWLDPEPLAPVADYLEEGMMARMLGRNMQATMGYFELNNGAMCWMDLEMLMFEPPEGAPADIVFDLMAMPVVDMSENGNGDTHGNNGQAPMFDTSMFYYGGACAPQQVEVQMMVDAEDIFNVVMFYRLQDVESGEKTAWTGVSMNVFGNDYYKQVVHSSNIPDASMFNNAYFQVQFVVTNAEGEEILRTEVFPEMVMLSACGGPPPPARHTPTPTPVPPPR